MLGFPTGPTARREGGVQQTNEASTRAADTGPGGGGGGGGRARQGNVARSPLWSCSCNRSLCPSDAPRAFDMRLTRHFRHLSPVVPLPGGRKQGKENEVDAPVHSSCSLGKARQAGLGGWSKVAGG